jgi:hypothetical protein
MRRTRPTHTARTEVVLVARSADQGMQGYMWSLVDRVRLPEHSHVCENGGVQLVAGACLARGHTRCRCDINAEPLPHKSSQTDNCDMNCVYHGCGCH